VRLCHPRQLVVQVARRLPSPVRLLAETLLHDAIGRRRGDRLCKPACVFPANAVLPVSISYSTTPNAKDVRARIRVLPFELLGRHVLKRPEDRSLRREVLVGTIESPARFTTPDAFARSMNSVT